MEEVRGDGVVGLQPEMNDGNDFTYTSGCPLNTPTGIMYGSYLMRTVDGKALEISIPAFSLDLPDVDPVIN